MKNQTGVFRLFSARLVPALFVAATLAFSPVRASATDVEIERTAPAAASPGAAAAPAGETAPEPDEYTGPRELTIENSFIKIVANTMPVDTGRFLVRTVKGDPGHDTDDNKILIYGGAVPWTSFTTLRIDGKDYVFGGPTQRRAGQNALYGEVTEQPHKAGDNSIVTKCAIAGLEVTETLSIVGGPVSKLFDTVKISYEIRNTSGEARRVGLRIVLDTLLGSNDASPFKVGERNITTETELTGTDILDYWIAYDSLEDPGVVARGTLRGPGLATPDRVIFTNWGKLADNIWDIPYSPGQPFQREGEADMDSATALYWDETTIQPSGEIQDSTLYGIDYLNVTGEVLSIGANRFLGEWSTAKNQLRPYTLYAYVANSANFDLNDVLITLDLPDGIELAGDDTGVRRIGKLAPGQEITVGWAVQPKVAAGGDKTIKIVGSAQEVESVELKTGVTLLSPPGITPTVIVQERVTRTPDREYGSYGPPFPVKLKCRNEGKSPLDNLRVELVLPDGLEFPRVQNAEQSYRRLEGLEEVVFSWKVMPTGDKSGDMDLTFKITSDSTEDKTVTYKIGVDPLPVAIAWSGAPNETYTNVFFPAELFVTDLDEIGSASLSVKFNPDVLQVVRVSQGTLFVENGQPLPWSEPVIDNKLGVVSGISGSRTTPLGKKSDGSLVVIHFRAVGLGKSPIGVVDLKLTGLKGSPIEYQFENTTVSVTK
jgi:hypothetical protein